MEINELLNFRGNEVEANTTAGQQWISYRNARKILGLGEFEKQLKELKARMTEDESGKYEIVSVVAEKRDKDETEDNFQAWYAQTYIVEYGDGDKRRLAREEIVNEIGLKALKEILAESENT